MSVSTDEISASPRRARIIMITVASLFTLLHLFLNALHLVDRELWLDEASTYGVAAHSFWRNFRCRSSSIPSRRCTTSFCTSSFPSTATNGSCAASRGC